ncbi:MAG: gliding motility lipoprotein GldD [Bacteroidetes bacterium]|nr:gliding motility lipoprotein GldD [Bacteroidota bacterium]
MDPSSSHFFFLRILLQPPAGIINPTFYISAGFILELIFLFVLLSASGFISGAETAFFAITPTQLAHLKNSKTTTSRVVHQLLNTPKRLLATLLIAINFVNIAIIVFSSVLISQIFIFDGHEVAGFIIQVVAVTFVIVVFCEVLPKVYATQNALRTAHRSVYVIFALDKLLRPFSALLVLSTSFVDKRIHLKGYDVTVDELTHAIDITSNKDTPEEEKKILKGIARFGNIDVKQIMKPRMDVISFDKEMKFPELFSQVLEHRYSRIPVYTNTFDSIAGILYIKDLLPYLDKQQTDFEWQKLIRPAYFVPESKKINDLLQEFQEKKNHLAIVVDEYGGSSGIVTMEDILEEIVGEINDEFDEEELVFSKLDELNYVFEGKTLLNDVCRVMEVDRKIFDIGNEEVDTLAGLILELKGSIPYKFEVVKFNDIAFTIESADRRRIKRVKITLPEKKEGSPGNPVRGITLLSVFFLLASILLSSCDEEFVPKPRGYFRISFPEKKYIPYTPADCPFAFDVPAYTQVVRDTEARAEPCWMDIRFNNFRGTLYISYKEVNHNLRQFMEDSRTLALKHIPKASGIDEIQIQVPENHVYGTRYDVKGNAASPIQFFITDSTRHFLRASLYFYASPNSDSIAPVLKFISSDIDHLLATFRWK